MKPKRIDVPLTEEQRQLAETYHNLIYSFAHKYGLDIEEWYGALAIGLLRGIADWDPERGALSTSAYNKMLSVYGTEVSKCRTIKRTAQIVSLDAEVSGTTGTNHHTCIPDPRDHMGDTILLADVQRLSPRAQKILLLRAAGYSQREISGIMGISQAHVSRLLKEAVKAIVA